MAASLSVERLGAELLDYMRDQLGRSDVALVGPITRLLGGYDTEIFAFAQTGAAGIPARLVLRLYRVGQNPQKVLSESVTQNAMAAQGLAAAPVYFTCMDVSVLGRAFIVMAHMPGSQLIDAPADISSTLMGEAHAALHDLDPAPVIQRLNHAGVDAVTLDARLAWLDERAQQNPAIGGVTRWLAANRPSPPDRLSVCHCDWHKLNLLYEEGNISAILDWSAAMIADPVFDVATTIAAFTIVANHLAAAGDFAPVDNDKLVSEYLAGYERQRKLDRRKLDYFITLRCALSLVQGFEGHPIYKRPAIASDLAAKISGLTGVEDNEQ
jgi:aminoglycoside phosphotransferase (APT) family kinase protein